MPVITEVVICNSLVNVGYFLFNTPGGQMIVNVGKVNYAVASHLVQSDLLVTFLLQK